jgi:formylglycine-generating enzyme required for sulfatase activity
MQMSRIVLGAILVLVTACATAPRRSRGPVMPPRPGSMAPIEGGTFEMGTDSSEVPLLAARYGVTRREVFETEIPKRRVRVASFALDRFEVTNAEFASFLEGHPEWRPDRIPARYHNGQYLQSWTAGLHPTGQSDHPVTYVPWYAARAYCQAAGKRLPTEAEWEYAARGGERGEVFPWGEALPDSTHANWSGSGRNGTTPVGRYAANEYGLFDMAGNVWEYTSDEWPGSGEVLRYAIRGGSWQGAAVNLRVRYRDSHPANGAGPHVGFRCARGGRTG